MVDTYKVTLFKKESVYGTDAAPVVGTNGALTRNFNMGEPIQVDQLDRPLDLPSRGRRKSAATNARVPFSYELEMAGSGTAGTAPPWMEHLEMCGMAAPVLTAVTDAQQKFAAIGTALSSGTLWHWMGGMRTRARGSRATFGFDFTVGAYPFLSINGMGLLPASPTAPIDTTAPGGAVDLDRWIEPVEVNTDNTDFTLDGYALVLRQFTGAANADVQMRNLVGANYVVRGNHAWTGTIVAEAPALGTKDYFAKLKAGDEMVVHLQHGTVAGNIVEVDGDQLQILRITRSEDNDVMMVTIEYGLNITAAGQDDLLFTAR